MVFEKLLTLPKALSPPALGFLVLNYIKMIQINEVRWGNWIYSEDPDFHWQVYVDDFEYIFSNPSYYHGIPLTEEWLLKFGFEKKFTASSYKSFRMRIRETDFYLRPSLESWYWGFVNSFDWNKEECELNDCKEISFVHELQNFYFVLTGEELTI